MSRCEVSCQVEDMIPICCAQCQGPLLICTLGPQLLYFRLSIVKQLVECLIEFNLAASLRGTLHSASESEIMQHEFEYYCVLGVWLQLYAHVIHFIFS